jgi:NMD protein affecting ribosome stability and mRNA decay
MSRQSRWQEERRRMGVCTLCGRPGPPELRQLCLECAVKRRERNRERRGSKVRYTNAKSYQLSAPKKRVVSADVRKRIADAQRKRWAALRAARGPERTGTM